MKDSSMSIGGKAIKISPDDITFDSVVQNQIQVQQVTMKNSLSAPVELTLKSSNSDRIDTEPKFKKLAPPLAQKTGKIKETIFIKSDFFDQKINVTIIPSLYPNATGSTTPRDTSLTNSIRTNHPFKSTKNRDQSKEYNFGGQIESSDQSSPQFKIRRENNNNSSRQNLSSIDRELSEKEQTIQELGHKVRKLEVEAQNAVRMYKEEVAKRKEIEDRFENAGYSKDNEQLLQQFKVLLREREPNLEQLMELTLKKERDQQERKDAKILEILKIKDKQMEEIQTKFLTQESENSKLISALQDHKRQIKQMEQREKQITKEAEDLELKLQKAQSQISELHHGEQFKKLQYLEDKLKEANDYIQSCQDELLRTQTELQEKAQIEQFFEEAMQRFKDQAQIKDRQISQLSQELEVEKEMKIRQEEHLKVLMDQLNQVSNSSHQERDVQAQFMKQERDYIDRINKLQVDKQSLFEGLESFKSQSQEDQDNMRQILEKLNQITESQSKSNKFKKQQNLPYLIDEKVEELAGMLKSLQIQNQELALKNTNLIDKLKDRESELQKTIEENEDLSDKVNVKKRLGVKSVQTSIQMEDLDKLEKKQGKSMDLLKENNKLKETLNELERNNQYMQNELDTKNQELMMLIRSNRDQTSQQFVMNGDQNNLAGNSYTSVRDILHQNQTNPNGYSQFNQSNMGNQSQEELISKLNAKISQMKMNETKLYAEIEELTLKLASQPQKSHTFQSMDQSKLQNSSLLVNRGSAMATEEKISEYETIILEQRQQLLGLSEENLKLKHEIASVTHVNQVQQEEMKIRLKNLNELKEKHESINYLLSSQVSESGYFGGMSQKSTTVETERMRQHVQQLELNQMTLKHQTDEMRATLNATTRELAETKGELLQSEQIAVKLKSELQMMRVGLANSDQDSKLGQKVVEQRNKIKYLQGLLIRAKQDFDKLQSQKSKTTIKDRLIINASESQKSIDKLRREHQAALLMVIDLKEEYTHKLMIFADKHETQREKLKNENLNLTKKLDNLQVQLQYMDKKEIRLFGQLEEVKQLQELESNEKDTRTRELEELLFKKEETINELEREIKSKEKTIQDRQEQIAVLIGTLESERTVDESRQKLLNLTAELCSVKAIQSQADRKINEMTQILKKSQLSEVKLNKQMEIERIKVKEIQSQASKQEKQIDEQQKQIQEARLCIDERDRELNEMKFRNERFEFQLQMKDQTLQQMRDSQRRTESEFKEEIDRIRKEFNERFSTQAAKKKQLDNMQSKDTLNAGNQLKTAIQQLHLCISDYMSYSQSTDEQRVIQEFEKALNIAASNIEKLQEEIDKLEKRETIYQQDLKATALNKILIQNNENLLIKIQKLQTVYQQREDQRESYMKHQELQWAKIIKEQDSQIEILKQQYTDVEVEQTEMRDKFNKLKDQKEDLEQGIVMFEQEQQNKQSQFERKAELTVDERFKSKHEIIKAYFDSNITRILLNTQNTTNDRILDLGRELVAQKILIQKLQSQLELGDNENQGLQLNLQHYKEQNQVQEQRVRDLQVKINQLSNKLHHQDLQGRIEIERKRREIIQIEKDLLKTREQVETKTREVIILQDQLEKDNLNPRLAKQNNNHSSNLQDHSNEIIAVKDQEIKNLNQQLDDLQERLVNSRAQQIQEIEDLKVQYDLELSEQRRNISKEREQLEKRFMPGYAPGDLMENNQDLQNRIVDLKNALDRIMQENAILRKKIENEKQNNDSHRSEINSYKQALQDLESTMAEMSSGFNQQSSQMRDQRSKMSIQQEEKKAPTSKAGAKKKQNSLHFNKDAYQSESDQYSHSKINHNDQSSLNVSALTSVNMIQNASNSLSNNGRNQRQFVINPPPLIKALIQSKVSEMLYKKKCEDLIQIEVDLRLQIKELSTKHREQLMQQRQEQTMNKQRQGEQLDYELDELRRRLIELEIENEDLKLNRAQDQINTLQLQQQYTLSMIKPLQSQQNYEHQGQYVQQDFNTLIEAIIYLVNRISNDLKDQENQANGQQAIEEGQRLVIRSLLNKINFEQGISGSETIQYAPSEEKDRKLWYLELLEQQVNSSESVVNQLQSFIKKLSIDISGNLQSAAQIKAASMDLAQNTMKTSDEIKTLKHIVGLIKHDLNRNFQLQRQMEQTQAHQNSNSNNQVTQQNMRTINPFEKQSMFNQAQIDQLINNSDQLQNQLTITEKVKKTLEQEIVQLKINHSQEQQSISQKLNQALDQKNSLLQTNEELHSKVTQLQTSLEKLRGEINNVQEQNNHHQSLIMEKEREKQLIAQNKTATQKHLQKLQQDMNDWRHQTDENIKIKERQIADLNGQVQSLTKDRERLKSENQMLRRCEKDRKSISNEDLKKLEHENKNLMEKLNQQMNERKKEIEFWVTERATMREMINQLECEKVENDIEKDNNSKSKYARDDPEAKVKNLKKKLSSKIKQKDVDLRLKDKQLQDLSDELNKVKYSATLLEQRMRESSSRQAEAEERLKYMNQKLKEVELERDLVMAEKNNALQTNDVSAAQIQVELNSLRECFAKLKVERDNLLYEIQETNNREQDWRQTVEKLSDEIQNMERNILSKEREQNETIKVLETKCNTFMSDLKYLKQDNDKLRERSRDMDSSQIKYEQQVHQEQMKQQELIMQIENGKRHQNDLGLQLKGKENQMNELQQQFLLLEANKMRDIQDLKTKIEEIKEANAQIIALYENQLNDLKLRFINDKQKTEQQVDNMFSIAQRESVVKNLKKELTQAKALLNKSKTKNKSLKAQIQNQENISNNQRPRSRLTSQKHSFKESTIQYDEFQCDKDVYRLSTLLMGDDSGYKGMLEQLQKVNHVNQQFVEVKADLEKANNWNMVISQQLQEYQERNQELLIQIDNLSKVSLKENSRINKSQIAGSETISKYKVEIKNLSSELESMKQEWLPPREVQNINERLKDANNTIKTLKDEVQRKREVITQLKQQRGQTEVEATQILNEMEGLKDDNIKLQKLIKENNKNMKLAQELKSANDYMKVGEKRMKEEISQLNEKLKQARVDITRKEQLIKEYKDKLDLIQDEINQSNQRVNEIEKLKELNKKLKLESEIKENQVKTLKQRLEHNDEEIENLKTVSQSQINSSQSNQLENQVRITKNKIKKYEVYLKKSLETLRKIGKELSHTSSKMSMRQRSNLKASKKTNDNPMQINEFERDFYKDSVNILGVSMDELEEFMNPSLNHSSSEKNIENQNFMAKLERVSEIPETLNQDLEQICNYCVKLISEINPDVSFK
ncbi:UNKNOWN [Stylonychia lemnae]|uniref:Uncharacterized protein n=1 Tax=Stylonychia lemnae TaxID=5949 RepID=A0A077ZPQ0_STYLE|nr:UNKNOWN [Stylonychia lemnae]|eukprot:CDW71439.1 UNKNOWN [Stylonychia lemnae]